MSLHHLAEHINYELEDLDGRTETDIIVAALDKHVAPILEKTLELIADLQCDVSSDTHQVRLLKDEIYDLLEGKFR
jgi:hypothetical protein